MNIKIFMTVEEVQERFPRLWVELLIIHHIRELNERKTSARTKRRCQKFQMIRFDTRNDKRSFFNSIALCVTTI